MELTKRYNKDLTHPDLPRVDAHFLDTIYEINGSSGLVQVYLMHFYRKGGVQLRVDAELSADLDASDFREPDPESLLWPSHTIEFFFEDPSIPTMMLGKYDRDAIGDEFNITMDDKEPGFRFFSLMECDRKIGYTLTSRPSQHREMLLTGDIPNANGAVPLSKGEDHDLVEMTRLCLKVLAYCSIPRFRYAPVTEITKRMGGKPGFRNRPKRPAQRVSYLPSIVTLQQREDRTELDATEGRAVTPHNRRGHLRYYSHARWKEMRGKWSFIPPIRVRGGAQQTNTVIVKKV